eukprot:12398256-Karenia_brevis.AAC.1
MQQSVSNISGGFAVYPIPSAPARPRPPAAAFFPPRAPVPGRVRKPKHPPLHPSQKMNWPTKSDDDDDHRVTLRMWTCWFKQAPSGVPSASAASFIPQTPPVGGLPFALPSTNPAIPFTPGSPGIPPTASELIVNFANSFSFVPKASGTPPFSTAAASSTALAASTAPAAAAAFAKTATAPAAPTAPAASNASAASGASVASRPGAMPVHTSKTTSVVVGQHRSQGGLPIGAKRESVTGALSGAPSTRWPKPEAKSAPPAAASAKEAASATEAASAKAEPAGASQPPPPPLPDAQRGITDEPSKQEQQRREELKARARAECERLKAERLQRTRERASVAAELNASASNPSASAGLRSPTAPVPHDDAHPRECRMPKRPAPKGTIQDELGGNPRQADPSVSTVSSGDSSDTPPPKRKKKSH